MRIGTAFVGVLVLAGVAWFVLQAVSGRSGGASSPDAAVEQLVKAANAKDPAAVVAVLNPDETDQLANVVTMVQDRAQKTGSASTEHALDGFDVNIEGLQLSDDELADDVVKVTIDDVEVDLGIDADKVADRVRTVGARSDSVTLDTEDLTYSTWDERKDRERDIDPFVIAVKRGGGWYLSPEYTLLQYWVEVNGLPDPDFGSELPSGLEGASSPKEALQEFANSIDHLDVEDWMAYVPANERTALWAYRDAIDEALRDSGSKDERFGFEVDDLEVTEKSLPKGAKALTVDSAAGTARDGGDGEKTSWRYDGRCVHTSGDDDDDKQCASRTGAGFGTYYDVGWGPLGPLWKIMGDGGTVVVSKEDGSWVVSPLTSLVRTIKEQVTDASTEQLYGWAGLPELAPATGQLELGKTVSGTFNDGGYAVFDVTLEEGKTYGAWVSREDQDDDACYSSWSGCFRTASLFGDVADQYSDFGTYLGDGASLISVERSGPGRLVLAGTPGAEFSASIGPLHEESMPSSGEMSGTFTKDRPIVTYKFTVQEYGQWQISSQGSESDYSILDEDGTDLDCWDFCELESGTTYRLVISGDPGDDYDVTVSRGGGTIDGEQSVYGYVYEGSYEEHYLSVSSGSTVVVSLEGDDSYVDIDFRTDDGAYGSSSYGSSESFVIDGPYEGWLSVVGFDGDSGYTLSVSEY